MQQALTSSVFRAVAVAGLLLALTLTARGRAATPHHEARLVLRTVSKPGAVYLSWWRDGDVRIELEAGQLPPMVFTARGWIDGCHWKGVETLDPIDTRHYAYSYAETLLHCRPGATPWSKTPRTGIVTVIEQ
jgi:hypothetical protein